MVILAVSDSHIKTDWITETYNHLKCNKYSYWSVRSFILELATVCDAHRGLWLFMAVKHVKEIKCCHQIAT